MIEYIKLYYYIMGALLLVSTIVYVVTDNELVGKIAMASLTGVLSPLIGLFMAVIVVFMVVVIISLPTSLPIMALLDKDE